MIREALVVGINSYQQLPPLNASAGDAEAIAQILEQYGEFRVRRLPQFHDPFENNACRVARNQEVSLVELEEALVQLLKPDSRSVPDTALFFFSGHGLRKQRGIQEGFLATSDSQCEQGFYGLSLQWLRRLLQESEVRQQVIWLDCCHSGELLQFEEADPGDRGKGRDRCFIAASRSHQQAYESSTTRHSLLTQAILDGLAPQRLPDRGIDNLILTNHINQSLRGTPQSPVCTNAGEPIRLCYRSSTASETQPTAPPERDRCPYKGLAYFDCNNEDPKYFYGRTALVDSLLNQVRHTSFLALLGASGSGKSSALRAGLLHQLKLGQRLSGSDQWHIHVLTPGAHPLQNLALALLDPALTGIDRATQLNQIEHLLAQGGRGMRQIAQSCGAPRLVIAVDQLEEVFTLCQDPAERNAFFACLLGSLATPGVEEHGPLLVLLALRADFFTRCMEQPYSGLGDRLRHHLVAIPPMNCHELRDAILQPARQVGLDIEPELIATMLTDLDGAPGHLPLLQYTLTELWKQRQDNSLTLHAYTHLGGILGTLRQRADAVYAAFDDSEKATAQGIFLALTQVNDGTEDTRRRIPKAELVTPQHPGNVVNRVLQRLTAEQLVVTSELVGKAKAGERMAVVDVAHEALIRHWPLLRTWINENRNTLKMRQKLEAKAEEWRSHNHSPDYLLRGDPLREAKQFQTQHGQAFPLSKYGRAFVQKSLNYQRRNRRIRMGIALSIALVATPIGFVTVASTAPEILFPLIIYQRSKQAFVHLVFSSDHVPLLMDGAGNVQRWNRERRALETLITLGNSSFFSYPVPPILSENLISTDGTTMAILGAPGIHLWQAEREPPLVQIPWNAETGAMPDAAPDHPYSGIIGAALSPDGTQVVYQTIASAIQLWNRDSNTLTTLQEQGTGAVEVPRPGVPLLSFSPDGQTIAAIAPDILRLWDRSGTLLSSASEPPSTSPRSSLKYLRFSPDGQRIATSVNGTIDLWDRRGRHLFTLVNTTRAEGWSVRPALFAFSPDGNQIATAAGDTVILWDVESGREIKTLMVPDDAAAKSPATSPLHPSFLRFSPDGQRIAWMQRETIALWSHEGEAIATLPAKNVPPDPPGWGVATNLGFIGFDFHPTQPLLVTSQFDGTTKLWNFQGETVNTLQEGVPLDSLPSPNENFLNPRNWFPPKDSVASLAFGTRQVQFQPDGEAIALIQNGALKLISINGGDILEIRPNGKVTP